MLNSINKVIKTLIFSDLVLLFGWGLISPILAIFILDSIEGGGAEVAGIAIGTYWLVKSIIQIPIANYLDQNHGEKDDFFALILGIILSSLAPIGFIFARLPWHMYVLEMLNALGMAMAIPSWGGIFHRHMVRNKEAFCCSLESSAVGISTGVAGILGGVLVKTLGFTPLFIGVAISGFISALLLLIIRKDILLKVERDQMRPISRPR